MLREDAQGVAHVQQDARRTAFVAEGPLETTNGFLEQRGPCLGMSLVNPLARDLGKLFGQSAPCGHVSRSKSSAKTEHIENAAPFPLALRE